MAAAALFASCSSSSTRADGAGGFAAFGGGGTSNMDAGVGGSATGGTGGVGTGGAGVGGGLMIDSGSTGGGGGFDPDSGCVAETQRGETVPVDMYIMLDISGSMNNPAGTGGSKWDAVRQALVNFAMDTRSAGLGVGIQFFPIAKTGVPATCSSQMDCGMDGPCTISVCEGNSVVEYCSTDMDCGANAPCVPFGQCAGLVGGPCRTTVAGDCGLFGNCVPFTGGECLGRSSCDPMDYSTPAVPISTLPGNSGALVAAINAQMPAGLTPTSAALDGAIDQASAFAQATPGHKVIVVFATDGIATVCDPTDIVNIQAIAASGLGATPSIETYVIGVFGPTDTDGLTNSNGIASSGGTSTAFIVDPAGNVTQQFLDALDAIRGGTLGCEFQVPDPPDGGALDFNRVNVRFVDGSGSPVTVLNVPDASQCDPVNGGWYYDVDPTMSQPTSIIACPASCDTFSVSINAQVDIALGCETMIAPPR